MKPKIRRMLASVAALATCAGAATALATIEAGPASAATVNVSDVSLTWGLSGEQGGGAFFGGCNFLSAGKAGDTGESRLWTADDGFYATHAGNVSIEKPDADGNYAQPDWDSKCQGPNGSPVNAGSPASLTGNRVVIDNGTGTVDVAANTATIHWSGSFTSAFYGGLTYWSATDPVLTVNADGTGSLTATASGYAADMGGESWASITPTTVTLANLHGVHLTETGVTVTPDYLGVSVNVPGGATEQTASTTANEAYWGSFPQDFVDFQQLTGQAAYWFSSGSSRDAAKPATPLALGYDVTPPPGTTTPGTTTPGTTTPGTTTPGTTTPGTTTPGTTTPSGDPVVHLTHTTVASGGELAFSATGFAPGEQVDVTVHSDPVTLDPVTADGDGAVSAVRSLPANLPSGPHHLVLTGSTSGATATVAFTLQAASSCELADGIKGGSLMWGFKDTFRAYIASAAGSSITAGDGAVILDADRAVPSNASSGTYQWPFESSSAYTSPGEFTAQYGGSVTLANPAHFLEVVISSPRVEVHGTSGTLFADLTVTVTAPGSPPDVDARSGVALASIDLTGTTPVNSASGISRVLHTQILSADAFTFQGNAFYDKGEPLDDATVLLSGCTDPATPPPGADGVDAVDTANLVPDAQFRPAGLAATGSDVSAALALGLAAVLGGLIFAVAGSRRLIRRKGAHQ